MVTGTTQSILARAAIALERGLGPGAAQLLIPVLRAGALSREDDVSVRAALTEALATTGRSDPGSQRTRPHARLDPRSRFRCAAVDALAAPRPRGVRAW